MTHTHLDRRLDQKKVASLRRKFDLPKSCGLNFADLRVVKGRAFGLKGFYHAHTEAVSNWRLLKLDIVEALREQRCSIKKDAVLA